MARYALPLSGYENASIWGYDEQQVSYFAQLWRNESDSWNDPDIWLPGLRPLETPAELAYRIAARTSLGAGEVARAMAAAVPAAEKAALLQLAENLSLERR
jgi:hypothetical protein